MGLLKDKMYYWLVIKNPAIREEYQNYVNTHQDEHFSKRTSSWKLLLKLNWHYRIKRKKTPYLSLASINNAPTDTQGKLPYLDGSESEGLRREDIVIFTKRLLNYDVVSFDIFDTLILRPFENPQDLFLITGNKLGLMNFKQIRADAERKARDKHLATDGNTEINIYDIYNLVARRTGIDVEKGIKAELETELEYCFANPYMKQVFKMLRDYGKEIVITSDMYIPHDMMTKIVEGCGYTGYSKLYVSCDYSCNKRNGGLFKNVINDHPGKSIVHIGDNYASDIQAAEKCGIEPVYYKNTHEIGNPYRADGMSDLVGSFYSGIVNTHLHNGLKTYNPYYEYGFIYGGFYITGYCNWIYQKAKAEGVEKILFLARDSDIYRKVFNYMFDDMPNEYVYWSRIANTKYSIEAARDDFLTRLVLHKAYNVFPCTLGEILDSFELSSLKPRLKESGLSEETLLTPELIQKFEDFFIDNYDSIKEIYRPETLIAERVFKKIIGDCKKVAVIDVGWLGSGPMGIKYLVEKKWNLGCEVKCYMVGSTVKPTHLNINELMQNVTEPYVFSRMYNRNLYDIHSHTNKGTNNIYFEFFTQACHPSFSGYSLNGDYIFDVPEVSNYEMTKEIQRGIIDFNKSYCKFSEHAVYLRNISGYDAYQPYRHAIRDPRLVKNLFSDASFSRGVGVNLKSQTQETVGDILKSINL